VAEVDLLELERYLRIFQENPDSRVFAPLADLYRRLGRLSEAEEICREGMKRHPYYAGGRVALAHIFLDSNRLPEALVEAEAVVTYYPDNLLARKILIRVLARMGDSLRASREFEALKHLAPQVAGDPELERSLASSARLSKPPKPTHLLQRNIPRDDANLLKLNEKTIWDPVDSPHSKDKKNHRLEVKKEILQTWLRMLGSSSNLR